MTATTQLEHLHRLSALAGRQGASWARRHARSAAGVAACLLLVAGCGSAAAPAASGRAPHAGPARFGSTSASAGPSGSGSAQGYPCVSAGGSGSCGSPPGASAAPQVSLDVTIYPANYPVNKTVPTQYTLYCEPTGGTVPDPAAACAQLLADPDLLFATQPVGIACPMIIADSSRFAISGTYLNRPVNEVVADGGCDLQRWGELRQIFPAAGEGLHPVLSGLARGA
jgi:hypothetical protein